MTPRGALSRFWEEYVLAPHEDARREAIWRLRARYPEASPPAEPEEARRVLESLLQHCHRDGVDGRFLAARLLRDLWTGLAPPVLAELFQEYTLRLLESRPGLHGDERQILWEAIEAGCRRASPEELGALCRELIARETARCLTPSVRSRIRNWLTPPAPDLEILELVISFAPAGVFRSLARDVWRLYDLVYEGLGGPEGGVFWLGFSRHMLERLLHEADPEVLGDAGPRLYRYLEALHGMGGAMEPLVAPLTAWQVPPVLKVLEAWSERGNEPSFREAAAHAADTLRAALGDIGSEVAPAGPPEGRRLEAAPATPPREEGAE